MTPEQEAQHPLIDTQVTDWALDTLAEFQQSGDPFFLNVGLIKPHLPFTFPEKFLDFYPTGYSGEEPVNPFVPAGMPNMAWQASGEIRMYDDVTATGYTGVLNSDGQQMEMGLTKELRRAYFASTSHMDEEFGRLMAALDDLGLTNNTVVAIVGDHGFQLGEHDMWVKHSNTNDATHVPMLIRAAGWDAAAIVVDEMVEAVDIFATVTELAGVAVPPQCSAQSSTVTLCTEGTSLVPLMTGDVPEGWKQAAFSQYPRECGGNSEGYVPYVQGMPSANTCMGYSMNTKQYRYTEWVDFDESTYTTDWRMTKNPGGQGFELYDLENDPHENVNLANDASREALVKELSEILHGTWTQFVPALPPPPPEEPVLCPGASFEACTDNPTPWMISNNQDCAKSNLPAKKCNKVRDWVNNQYCQHTCWENGNGYAGVECCPRTLCTQCTDNPTPWMISSNQDYIYMTCIYISVSACVCVYILYKYRYI